MGRGWVHSMTRSLAAMGPAVRHAAFSGGAIGERPSKSKSSSPPPSFRPFVFFIRPDLRDRVAAVETGLTMEKITDKIAALPPDANYFSLEFFPPKTKMVGLPRLPAPQ